MIGKHFTEIDTPALCIDLDAMEANIESMSAFVTSRGKQWRPHQKCHKSPAIAQMQINAGAIGVTCAKVSEAEVMASGGVRDILIANMIIGKQKLERVAALCKIADPIVAIDHYAQAEALAAVCKSHGITARVIVEVDLGMERVGSRPGAGALRLYEGALSLDGVRPVGIMGYEGHLQRVEDPEAKRRQIQQAMGVLAGTSRLILDKGYCCVIISAGGTGSYEMTSDCEGISEIQSGGIFGCPFYTNQCGVSGLTPALTVLATVVSRPALPRGVVDAGRKAIAADPEMPQVRDYPESTVVRLNAEHGMLELVGDGRDLKIGNRIQLTVGYADFTTMLHEDFIGFRGEFVETTYPIAGRGCIQ